jgi:hypothetical protein
MITTFALLPTQQQAILPGPGDAGLADFTAAQSQELQDLLAQNTSNLIGTVNDLITNYVALALVGGGVINAEVATQISAATVNLISKAVTTNFATGFTFTPYDNGTIAGGTFQPNPVNGNYQKIVNNGAHTLVPPASAGCVIDIEYSNTASAGIITPSGWSTSANTGDAFDTINGHKFVLQIRYIVTPTYSIKALQ